MKFKIGDNVVTLNKAAIIWAVHLYEGKTVYSVTFEDGSMGQDVPEEQVAFSEVEVLRREVARLSAEVTRLKSPPKFDFFEKQRGIDPLTPRVWLGGNHRPGEILC